MEAKTQQNTLDQTPGQELVFGYSNHIILLFNSLGFAIIGFLLYFRGGNYLLLSAFSVLIALINGFQFHQQVFKGYITLSKDHIIIRHSIWKQSQIAYTEVAHLKLRPKKIILGLKNDTTRTIYLALIAKGLRAVLVEELQQRLPTAVIALG